MPQVPVQFGEWRPDIALLDNEFASEAFNVFAGVNSYLPFPSLQPFSPFKLPGPVCGLYSARTTSGAWKTYAGTRTALFMLTPTGWVDISRTTGGAYHVAAGDMWSFAQFGTLLFATNINDPLQQISVDAGVNFTPTPGSPPLATNVAVIGDFLFLSGLAINRNKIIWSGINDTGMWTPGTNLCDEQFFPDNGPVQGIAGSEIGYVVQERGIRAMQFLPGDTNFIFSFTRVLHDRGCVSKYGFTSISNALYFVAEDGFYSIAGGTNVTPIGQDKVNDWFLKNSDVQRRNIVHAIPAINKPRLVWAYHTFSGSQVYDHVIIFDWSLARWVHATEYAQVWGLQASLNLDLDTTGAEVNDVHLDTPPDPPALPLDSFAYVGGRPLVGAINQDGYLCAINGPNLRAVMETADTHVTKQTAVRSFIGDVYPLVDGEAESVSVGIRERLADPVVWQVPQLIEITGSAAIYSSARLHRFRVEVPAGAIWTHGQGVMADVQQDGTVA
jgi:hypothetical protein